MERILVAVSLRTLVLALIQGLAGNQDQRLSVTKLLGWANAFKVLNKRTASGNGAPPRERIIEMMAFRSYSKQRSPNPRSAVTMVWDSPTRESGWARDSMAPGSFMLLRVSSFFLACAVSASLYGQSLTVPSSAIAGVNLIGPGDSSFIHTVTQVLGPSRTPSISDWLPFSVVVSNSSSQPMVGIVVRWALFDSADNNNHNNPSDVYTFSRASPSPTAQLPPGKTVVVLPGWVLQMPVLSSPDPTSEPDHFDRVQSFRSATRIEITLDGVVFASGQFVGPDLSHEFESMSERQAALGIFSTVLSQSSAGQLTDNIVTSLRAVAAESITMRTQATSQDDAIRILTVRFARQLIQEYDEQGEAQMFALAKARAQNRINIFR